MIYAETRYEPFWHVSCRTSIEFTRQRDYEIKLDRNVTEVTLAGTVFPATNNTLRLAGVEKCVDKGWHEQFIDAHSGKKQDMAKHIAVARSELQQTEELMVGEQIVVPAKIKASIVLRELLAGIMKPVQGDEIVGESFVVETLNLYFRPIYAFEYQWTTQDKTAVCEVDAVTGDWVWGRAVREKMGEIFSEDTLFEIGGETLGLVVPGGNLAVKLARAALKGK